MKNLWHCFGCGAAGGPIDWVMKLRGISFRHAVEQLREGLPSLAAEWRGASARRSRKLAAPVAFDADDRRCWTRWCDYYHETLLEIARGAGLPGTRAGWTDPS